MSDNQDDPNRKASGIPNDLFEILQTLDSDFNALEDRLDCIPPMIRSRFRERLDALRREWDVARRFWDDLHTTDDEALADQIYGLKLSLRALQLGYERFVKELDDVDPDNLADL